MFSDSEPKRGPPVPQLVVVCDHQGMLVSGAPSAPVAVPKPIET
jgi:hypothetical protein